MRHFFASTVIYSLLGFGVVFLAIDCQWKNTAYRRPVWVKSGQVVRHIETKETGVVVGTDGKCVRVQFTDGEQTISTSQLVPIR